MLRKTGGPLMFGEWKKATVLAALLPRSASLFCKHRDPFLRVFLYYPSRFCVCCGSFARIYSKHTGSQTPEQLLLSADSAGL